MPRLPSLFPSSVCSIVAFLFIATLYLETLVAEDYVEKDVPFVAKLDGSEQRYVMLAPANIEAEVDCLIALHGHGSDRWQFARDNRDECRSARDFAKAHRMLYISPDYRAKTSWMGPAAEADLVQIIEEVRAKHKVRNVYLCGGSMGGSSTLTFAALHPDLLAGVCSMNGTANHLEYDQFQDAIRESFGGAKSEFPEEYKKRSAEYWPEKFTMRVAMTTGGKDTLVPPASCQRLADILEKLNREVLLIHREEGGHSTNYEDGMKALEFMLKK